MVPRKQRRANGSDHISGIRSSPGRIEAGAPAVIEADGDVVIPQVDESALELPVELAAPRARHEIPHEDIGNWKFTPWKGIPMWTHVRTGESSFKGDYVSRRRNQ